MINHDYPEIHPDWIKQIEFKKLATFMIIHDLSSLTYFFLDSINDYSTIRRQLGWLTKGSNKI